jgi:hypothetical protein
MSLMFAPVIAPGDRELAAIRPKYPDVTLQTLSDGHALYTGACVKCHEAKNIHTRTEERWPAIIDNMAARTRLSAEQKDAVLKYVLSVKAAEKQH